MSEISVEQLAQEYNAPKEEFVILLRNNNVSVKNASSVLSEEQANTFRRIHSKPEVRKSIRAIQEDLKNKKSEESKKAASNKEQKKPAKNDSKENSAAQKKQPAKAAKEEKAETNRAKKPKNADKGERPVKTQQRPNNQSRQNQRRKNNNREVSNQNNNRNSRPRQQTRSANSSNQQNSQNKNNRNNSNRSNNNKGNYSKPNTFKRNNNAGPSFSNNNQSKPGKKQKKNYKDKKAERPIKLRDNRKRTKNKRVDYKKQREERQLAQKKNRVYEIPELLTIGQLAETLDIAATEIIKVLMANGTMATINQQIDADTAEIVASELGYEVQTMTTEDVVEKLFEEYDNQVTGKEVKRPPVVTVMGHVDHGKTSLLDRIRKTNVTAGEAGGITQHIGAYTVRVGDEKITFIDTPGHAAFTAMRSRGAQMTDIAVLVVAADDGVMPQTIEAINHAKAAEVPIIVAINKIDKEGSNPERVKQELTEQGLVVEEWGGETIAVPISARQGTNIDELLENILLVAEMEELQADPNRPARGSVIESEVKKGKGSTASLLIQQGTLNVGDSILSGTTYGKIRTMIDDKGKRIRRAGPSTPVEISGLSDLPEAGEDFIVLSDEKEARQLAQQRLELQKKEQQQKNAVSLNDLFTRIQEGQISDVNLIVKADVNGSVEAISQSLERLNTDEVRVNVIHGAVGAVNETDIMLASTTGAIIIAFNVRSDRIAKIAAEKEEVDVRYYTVIYDAIEDVKKAMEGLLEPEFVENVIGEAEVREVFRIPGGTMIAGSYVTDGRVKRNDQARVLRDGVIIYQGNVGSLRRFKDDVREVAQGYECGIGIENMNDIKVGDIIELYEMEAVKREL